MTHDTRLELTDQDYNQPPEPFPHPSEYDPAWIEPQETDAAA